MLQKIGNFFTGAFKTLGNNQLGFQSLIFWIVAFFKITTPEFWMFAGAAITFGGLQEIINQLKERNN